MIVLKTVDNGVTVRDKNLLHEFNWSEHDKYKRVLFNGQHMIYGRFISVIAKVLTHTKCEVHVINYLNLQRTGSLLHNRKKLLSKKKLGYRAKGFKYYRTADRIFMRSLRGMIGYRKKNKRVKYLRRVRLFDSAHKIYADSRYIFLKKKKIIKSHAFFDACTSK